MYDRFVALTNSGLYMSSVAWVKRCYSEKSKNLNKLLFLRHHITLDYLIITLHYACSVILNFLDKMASSR